MSEWKEYRLGDLLKIKYGKDHKKLGDGDIPIYGSGGIMRTGNAYLSDKPSVLIPRKGTLSNIFYVEEPFWTVDTMFWSEINDSIVIPKYLYYAIKDYKWDSLNVGSAVPSLTVPVIESVTVSIPSIELQLRISAQLSEIDSKIAVNRRICENLEAQAQALFKHWFIDFAPFKNGKFVESELGMIPEGWRVGTLGEICKTNKRTLSSKNTPDVIEYLDTGNITANRIDNIQILHKGQDKIPSRAKRLVSEGDIIFSAVRPNQRHYGLLMNPSPSLVVSTGFVVITANWSGFRYFIYHFLIQNSIIETLQAIGEQSVSTYPSINANDIESLKLIIPKMEDVEDFADICCNFYCKIESIEQESTRLSTLRDTLLPKLMSGQIKV